MENGVRVVAERMPATKSVTIGVWVNVGSRDEQAGEEGVSHFIEHMFFKGTKRRSAAQISHEIDALGGEMNAFTSRETTTLYVKVIDQQLQSGLSLLADLFHNSKFEPSEVEKEKQVVLEEIRMVQDDPEDLLHDMHHQHQLQQHPLGRPILGEPAIISRFRREHLFRYVRDTYAPDQTVIAVAGNFEWKLLAKFLGESFGGAEWSGRCRVPQRRPAEVGRGLLVRKKDLEQAHLCLGLQGVSIDHEDRYAAHVLNTVLGGGVSSRLFQKIREERGLAYSIYSYLSSFSDSGTLTVYAATRPKEAPRVIELACKEFRRIRSKGLTRWEVRRAKNQMKGGLMLNLESTQARMGKLAKDELHHERHTSLEEMLRCIDRVSESQVNRLAQDILDRDRLSVTALGPVSRQSLQAALN